MNADELLRVYFHQLHGGGAESDRAVGRSYAQRCGEADCHSRKYHETLTGRRVCGKCGADWPFEEIDVATAARRPRPSRKDNRTWPYIYVNPTLTESAGPAEDRMVEVVEVGIVLDDLERERYWRYAVRLWTGFVLTSAGYELLATYANEVGWPTWRGEPWNYRRVEWAVGRARGEFSARYKVRTSRAGDNTAS